MNSEITRPSGTVTFLFSDIEGSTRRWQDEPEAMRALLVEHDTILRDVIVKHHGYLFKHTGDGVAAVFASAADACAAAVDAQARLHGVLPVRMGLHTGEAELRDGDYFGSTLNRCARLMGVAHGGQVVCSAATVELVRDRDDLTDLGEHRLRDLSRPERVWQVGGGDFSRLRSLDAARTNLPLLGNVFVGRQSEMVEIVGALGESRLVTLTGVGGVGKTRLAVQVAAELLPGFADGVWVCELAAASTGEDMVQVVASALGVVQRQQMTLAGSIVDFLRTRQVLVVLDNCEHLLDAAAELAEDILAGATQVRVLATSREGFGIAEERVRPLRSLSVASESGETSDAVVLFVERARAVAPGFVLDAATVPVVVELCRRLDGIPLAIELAAARVATMAPAEIVGHLDERFRLLTGGRRGRVERHQTLRAAIEWSYSLLDDTERTVFDRLGVFPASFDEAAAIAVATGEGVERWDVIDTLASLAAKSMIGAEPAGTTTRYQLLETLRHFAREQAGEELDGLRRRHAAHYATLAEQIGSGLLSRDELVWRPRLAVELDNVRAAVGWAFDAPDLDDVTFGVRILDGLVFEALQQPSWGIQAWVAAALARVDQLEATRRVGVYAAASIEAFSLGDMDRTGMLGRPVIAESATFTPALYTALCMVSTSYVARSDPAAAMAVLAEGRRLLPADAIDDWPACALHNLTAAIANLTGDHDTARSEVLQGVAVARRVGMPSLLAAALSIHGQVLCDENPQDALSALDEAIRLFEAGAGNVMYPPTLMISAVLRAGAGNLTGAVRAVHTVVGQAVRNGRRPDLADGVAIAALVLAGNPDSYVAAATLGGARHGLSLGQIGAIYSAIHQGRYDRALEQVATSLGHDAYTNARQHGAAMTYDEIIAYTLDQLARLTDR